MEADRGATATPTAFDVDGGLIDWLSARIAWYEAENARLRIENARLFRKVLPKPVTRAKRGLSVVLKDVASPITLMAQKVYEEEGRSTARTAKRLGVADKTVYNWRKKFGWDK